VAGANTITVETTGLIDINIGGYVAVYHMNDDPADDATILDSTANGNDGSKPAHYATTAANIVDGTGSLATSPTEVAAGTGGATVAVTTEGTFNITVPANQYLDVSVPAEGGVTSVDIDAHTGGARVITVVGTGNFTATWRLVNIAAPAEVAGPVGMAQQFDGISSQYIELPFYLPVAEYTISVLFQRLGAAGGTIDKHCLLSNINGHAALDSSRVSVASDGLNAFIRLRQTDIPIYATWTDGIAGGSDTGVVIGAIWNGVDTAYGLLNGDVLGGLAYTSPSTSAALIRIGSRTTNYELSNGLIDEVWISSVALSPDEIAAIDAALRDELLYYGNEDPPPTLTTLAATGVYMNGGTHATLNGNLSSLGGAPTADIWFEWGYDTSYGNYAGNTTVSATGAYTATITGYDPDQTIYYRFVGENVDGTTYGSAVSFAVTPISGYIFLRLIPLLFLVGTVLIIWRNRNPWEIAMLAILGIIMAIVLHSIVIGYW